MNCRVLPETGVIRTAILHEDQSSKQEREKNMTQSSDGTRQEKSFPGYDMVRRQYFQLMPYQVLLIVVNAVNGIVDGVFASNIIGKTAMTAIGLFGPFNHFLYAVSMMLVSGSQILCGKYMGKNQQKELQNVFSVDLAFSILISAVTALLMVSGAVMNWTRVFAQDAAERSALNAYFLGQAAGVPGLILGQQLFAFLSMENQTRRTMIATLTCIVSNALMDFLFIALLNLGTFGLALASSVSVWVFFLIMAVYYRSGRSELRFTWKQMDRSEAKNIVLLGYAGSLSRFVEMFRCIVVNALILRYVGSVGLSSFAASNSVMAIFWSLPFGMMAVDRMLLSLSIGEEDRNATVNIMRVVTRWGVLLILCVAAVLSLMAEPLTRLFFRDPSDPVYGMTVMGLRILPFCMPFSVVNQGFSCYAQTMQKKLFSTVLPILNGAVHVILFSIVLIPVMQMNGLYLANILNGVCCLIVVVLFAAADLHRVPRNLPDLLAFPETFGAENSDFLEFSIRNVSEVSSIAKTVEKFCLSRGVDRRRSLLSGLALEEMAGNVVTHGFTADKRHHSADIRVTCKGEDVILRLRDDCVPFNPAERVAIMNPPDGVKNVGLRILVDSAKDVQYHVGITLTRRISREMLYRNVLGMNVLMIRI